MSKPISTKELQAALSAPRGLALIDVRETGEYNLAHIAGACSIPRRLVEYRLYDLVPYRGTNVIVCDDDGRRAALAAATMESMGYTNVSVLTGGLNRWVTDGYNTEWGLNVPSKDFGEKVLLENRVPEIDPDELHARQQRGEKMVILDSRTPEEHNRACIPGSRSMPGAELGLRVWDLMEDEDTTVIVHCAGRTRSIIGAGSLQRLGVKNVYALKNGTMGWQLAGLTLETGSNRLALPDTTAGGAAKAESLARKVAADEGVKLIGVAELEQIMERGGGENVYLFDVRSREEYEAGHIGSFSWVPGGQAVQATDNYVAVNDAVIVFACDGIVRSAMTASWFKQMGYANACVLDGGIEAWTKAGHGLEAGYAPRVPEAPSGVDTVEPGDASLKDATVIHVGTSEEFSSGHVPGSSWISRSWLELRIADIAPSLDSDLVVTSPDLVDSILACNALSDLGYTKVRALNGGMKAWRAAGLPIETGLTGVTRPPDDVLPVTRSYAEMLNYLRWEEALGEKFKD